MRAFPPCSLVFVCALLLAAVPLTPARAEDAANGQLHPNLLRCEALTNPLGIGERAPQLSWIGESDRRSERQTAYQILVASSAESLAKNDGDLWDSGKIDSDASIGVAYAGKPLASRAECHWKLRVWDRDGQPSAWSEPARWTVGLLAPEDWRAKWIDPTRPPPLADATANPELGITIKHATYGPVSQGGGSRDVTEIVAKLAASGAKDLRVTNDTMGGDPAYNQPKQLLVDLVINGEAAHASFPENSQLHFSQLSVAPHYLRRSFTAPAPVRRATLYITALGLYEATLNGQRVGDHVLAPDWTDYNRRVRYQAYDVTPLVRQGDNVLGALLANGWYAGHLGNGGFQEYGSVPALLAQLEITDADGQTHVVATDDAWKAHASPVTASDFMLGESYDARAEIPGWNRPGFDDRDWTAATVRDEKPRALDAQVMPPVRQTAERRPISLAEPAPGRWTYDLGQNMVGVVRLKITAPAGTTLTLRHAEMLKPDGTIYTTNLRGAPSTDTYVCKGGGEEVWQPAFTFHGFRYVELTGPPDKPAADAVTGVVIGTDNPAAGSFITSSEQLNQLVSNIEWGQRGNYLSVPTDCPQRDERLGWMGDAQVFVRTATDVADVQAFFSKWLVDVDDAQSPQGAFTDVSPERGTGAGTPAWGDAGVICPWTIYLAYGDKRTLERHLPAMIRWVEWCREHSTGLLRDKDRGGDYGDWLSINANTPKDVIGTAYFAYSTRLVSKACHALGKEEDAAKYKQLFQDIKKAFNRAYVNDDGTIKGNTQCGYVLALKFDLMQDFFHDNGTDVGKLVKDIAAKGNHLSTGFIGVSYLLPVLTDHGHLDVAYTLLNQDTFPSWLFSVKQGATTIWERWDGWTPEKGFQDAGMNSFNHYSLGSCGEWLYTTVAGIDWDPDAPGYKHLVIHPQPGGGLTEVKAGLRTVHGQVNSAWKVADGKFTYDLTLPANTTATVTLPTNDPDGVTADGEPLAELKDAKLDRESIRGVTFTLGSGSYRFVCPLR